MRSTCTAGTTLFKVTPQLHSTKPELRFSAGSKAAHGVLEICHGENLWQFCRLKIRLNAFRRSIYRKNNSSSSLEQYVKSVQS